jgi:hypothetical protein
MRRSAFLSTASPIFAIANGRLTSNSGRSVSKIFYAETFATTRRAISGLSRQTPSVRMTNGEPLIRASSRSFETQRRQSPDQSSPSRLAPSPSPRLGRRQMRHHTQPDRPPSLRQSQILRRFTLKRGSTHLHRFRTRCLVRHGFGQWVEAGEKSIEDRGEDRSSHVTKQQL